MVVSRKKGKRNRQFFSRQHLHLSAISISVKKRQKLISLNLARVAAGLSGECCRSRSRKFLAVSPLPPRKYVTLRITIPLATQALLNLQLNLLDL